MLFPDTDHPWEHKALGELFHLSTYGLNPKDYPREEFHHYSIPAWDEIGGPVVNLGVEIDSGKILLKNPCVLVSKLNPHILRVRVFDPHADRRRACASTEIMAYVARSSGTNLRFYSHYFCFYRFRKNLVSAATGTTNSHRRVRPPQTLQWIVPSPPTDEQAAIARILDAVDVAIERARDSIEDATKVKNALVQDFFYAALGVTAYADRPTKELPPGWALLPMEALISEEPKNGVSPKASSQPPGTPTFSIAAIRDGRVDLSNADHLKYTEISPKVAEKFKISRGDILIVRGNANPDLVGKAGRITDFPDGCIYPDITKRVVLRDDGERRLLPEFAVFAWNHAIVHNQILRRATTSNGTLKINSRDVKQVVMPAPPLKEQEEIVGLTIAVDAKIDALNAKLAALQQLKHSLLHDLLTGTVRVCDGCLAATPSC